MKFAPVLILVIVLNLGCKEKRITTYESIIGEYHAYIPEPATYENGGFCDTMCSIELILDKDLTYTMSISQSNTLKVNSYSGYWEMKNGKIRLLPLKSKVVVVAGSPWSRGETDESFEASKYWNLEIIGESNLVSSEMGFDAPVRFQREFIIF